MKRAIIYLTALGATIAFFSSLSVHAQRPASRTVLDGVYTAQQATRGETLYTEHCAACHDPKLVGGVGPALKGPEFISAWKFKTIGELFETIMNTMPQAAPGTLTPSQSADTVSFILSANQFPAGTMELAAAVEPLNAVKFTEPVQK